MPESDTTAQLRSLKPIDDSEAARMVGLEARAEMVTAILADAAAEGASPSRRPRRPRRPPRPPRPLRPLRPRWLRWLRGRPMLLAASLAGLTAALIVLVPGLFSGGGNATEPQSAQARILREITAALARRPGTIVLQRMTLSFTTVSGGKRRRPRAIWIASAVETSARGAVRRSFTSTSATRPGYQEVLAGNAMQLYDPSDNTIYVTTAAAEQRAAIAQIKLHAPPGTHVAVGNMHTVSGSANYVPGQTSVFERLLRAHQYRLAGRTTENGQPVLKLVQMHPTMLAVQSNTGTYESRSTAYVAPRTYDPIEEVARATLPGVKTTTVTRWSTYRVLPATAANRQLLALSARHPHARVVRDAAAYVRASDSEIRHTTKRVDTGG